MSQVDYQVFKNRYEEVGVIGSGSFGTILKLKHKGSGEIFALKQLVLDTLAQKRDARTEIQILKAFRHPLIIQIFEYYEVAIHSKNNPDACSIAFVTEKGGPSLQQLITDQQIHSPEVIFEFAMRFVGVFAWLEERNMVHRDIKPGNIVVCGPNLHCKLIDFGLCCRADNRPKAIAGSYHYVSPKMKKNFEKKKLLLKTNPFKDDVYSFGLTLYELTTRLISKRSEISDPYYDVMKHTSFQPLATLIDVMLTHEEDQRPTFTQLQRLPELKQLIEIEKFDQPRNAPPEQKLITYLDIEQPREIEEYRTEKKDQTRQLDRFTLERATIQSIVRLGDYLLCGCIDGTLRVANLGSQTQPIVLDTLHRRFISVLKETAHGDILSAGGDSQIILWDSRALLRCIAENRVTVAKVKHNVFEKDSIEESSVVKLSPQSYSIIKCPVHKGGISAVEYVSPCLYAVGYNSGRVFLLNDGKQLECKLHEGPVTSLKIVGDICFSVSTDGCMKSCNLITMRLTNRLHFAGEPILGIGSMEKDLMQLVMLSGASEVVNQNCQKISGSSLPSSNILACLLWKSQWLTLSVEGTLLRGGKVVWEAGGKGWNCMCLLSDREFVLASFTGEVLLLALDQKN